MVLRNSGCHLSSTIRESLTPDNSSQPRSQRASTQPTPYSETPTTTRRAHLASTRPNGPTTQPTFQNSSGSTSTPAPWRLRGHQTNAKKRGTTLIRSSPPTRPTVVLRKTSHASSVSSTTPPPSHPWANSALCGYNSSLTTFCKRLHPPRTKANGSAVTNPLSPRPFGMNSHAFSPSSPTISMTIPGNDPSASSFLATPPLSQPRTRQPTA